MLPSTSDDGSDAPLKRARRHGVVTAGKSVDHCTADMPFDGGCYVTATIGRKRFRGILVEESKLEELAASSASPTPDLTFMSLLQQLAPQPFQFPIADTKKNARPGRPRKSGPQTVVVVGAGLSGLAAAKELQLLGFRVTVLEARSEIGGRLRSGELHPIHHADGAGAGSVLDNDGPPVMVDLGASWVHGVSDNPVSALATAAGVRLVNTTANTIIRDVDGSPVPPDRDEFVEKLFNQMLDTIARDNVHPQSSRSVGEELEELLRVHEESQPLSPLERRLFRWHITNQEYSTGADISNLSPQELSETIDFEGAHCMVQGGYRQLAAYLAAGLLDIRLGSPVTRICYGDSVAEQAAKADAQLAGHGKLGGQCHVFVAGCEEPIVADAVLVTASLGVLKAGMIQFSPSLPAEVQQAIQRIGFGVINKVFLEFPWKFWGDTDQIGYASEDGQYFLFYDHHRVTGRPILMTLVPGSRGEQLEMMDEGVVVQSVMERLRVAFKDEQVPDPTKYIITKWRSDPYTRGTYSFLSPAATWVDMQQLQQSVRGKLFFAGEATIPKYNASTHGAYMSGIERARMICEALRPSKRRPDHYTPRVPGPTTVCELCGQGLADRTLGALIGTFHDGDEAFFVHECCAVFSPEVTQHGGIWFNVTAATRRGKKLMCSGCKHRGATIGCNVRACKKNYHVACAMQYTRWSFERGDQGKHFLCTEHRLQLHPDDGLSVSGTSSGRTTPHTVQQQQQQQHQQQALAAPHQSASVQHSNLAQLNALRMQSPSVWQSALGGMSLTGNFAFDAASPRPPVIALMQALMAGQQPPAPMAAAAPLPLGHRYAVVAPVQQQHHHHAHHPHQLLHHPQHHQQQDTHEQHLHHHLHLHHPEPDQHDAHMQHSHAAQDVPAHGFVMAPPAHNGSGLPGPTTQPESDAHAPYHSASNQSSYAML